MFNMSDKFELIISIASIAIVVALLIWYIYTLIILTNNKLYCKHYFKKEWNLWEKIIKELKKQKRTIYVSKSNNYPELNYFRINVKVDSKEYELIYWVKEETISVYQATDCILCGYDKYHSNITIKIMREKIKELFNNSEEKVKRMTKKLMGE